MLVLDCDEYARSTKRKGKISDYFVFTKTGEQYVIAAELKGGPVDVSVATAQLASSAAELDTITRGYHVNTFLPLILSGSIHATEFRVLGQKKILFRGVKWAVVRRRCGSRLSDVISKFGPT